MSNVVLSVGQKVELNDERTGYVRFVGKTDFSAGEWVGIELEEASGKNDGSVQGKRYFECPPAHGIFCRAAGVGRVLEEPRIKPKATVNAAARPSSMQGARRQTIQPNGRGVAQGTPTPAARVASGIRSPVKSPTKQLVTNGTSSSSTSRTGTPPVAGKRPVSGMTAKTSRPSIAPPSTVAPGRRTSTLPSTAATSRTTNARQPPTANAPSRGPTSRTAPGTTLSARNGPTGRPGVRQRLAEARGESTGDETSERSSLLSPRESSASEAASQDGRESSQGDQDDTIRNFAPPPIPPIPQDPPERLTRPRRPSSPAAASVHSQRTIRSTAARSRQVEELEAKIRALERKRVEDRDLRQNLDKAEQERDQYKGIIEKLQNKYRPQQQESERLKRELAESMERFAEIENIQAEHDTNMESLAMDLSLAEEQAALYKTELDHIRLRNEELEADVEILKLENSEMSKEMSPEERASVGWLQLEKSNERLKEALISLRDITQDKEAELKEQIDGLEKELKETGGLKSQYEETHEALLRNQADVEDLRQQLEDAEDANAVVQSLGEKNELLHQQISELRAAVEDLENLRDINDELEVNHVESEKQLQEEIDFKESLLLDRERTAKEQQAALDEADYNINRFRELVSQLQSDLQDLQASKQISESEAAQLSDKSRAMMDLNHKLQSCAAKTQVKAIDLELRKLDAQQAAEHLAIVQLFLPEAHQTERDSVLALLRFKRIGFKANLVQSFIKERIASFGTRGQDEAVFAACDALNKLTWIASMAERLVNSVSGCSAEAFGEFGSAFYELEVVERTLNDFVDALRQDELKEDDMPVRLGRSIEVMSHLSSLHLHNGLADHADDLMMMTLLLQSRMDSATMALGLTKTLLDKHLHTGGDEEDSDEESISDAALIINRLASITETARNVKVISGKTLRALSDLQSRNLTLEESLTEHFESSETVASEVASYACQSGAALQELFGEEGRSDPFTSSEVADALSRVAVRVFTIPGSEPGPYSTLATRFRDLSSLLADLSILPTDLDNTVEFERAPAPWVARSDQVKQTKVTSADTEAELIRAIENVKERDSVIRQKETELEEQSVRIEMLEARMKDASKRSAKIAELERSLREAKESESKSRNELAHAQNQARHELEHVREEMSRLAKDRQTSSDGKSIDGNAMGASVRITLKRQEHKIAGLEGAVRYLKEDNYRLRMPSATAPRAVKAGLDWLLQEPLQPPRKVSAAAAGKTSLRREGEKALEQMLALACSPATVDLTKLPQNKLAWRPVKESSRWKVEWRKEEYVALKERREELVSSAILGSNRTR